MCQINSKKAEKRHLKENKIHWMLDVRSDVIPGKQHEPNTTSKNTFVSMIDTDSTEHSRGCHPSKFKHFLLISSNTKTFVSEQQFFKCFYFMKTFLYAAFFSVILIKFKAACHETFCSLTC